MKNKLFNFMALNIVILLNFQITFADTSIYPKKKPILIDKEKIEKIIKKKKIAKKKLIIPKNKPLIVRKQTTRISKKSSYYSDRDFSYAKQSIQFMEKSNWKDALKVAN